MSSLYLLAICQSREIRSLRDLRYEHLPLLRKIRDESEKAAIKEYGLEPNSLRFFIHYQPTYCEHGLATIYLHSRAGSEPALTPLDLRRSLPRAHRTHQPLSRPPARSVQQSFSLTRHSTDAPQQLRLQRDHRRPGAPP